MCEPTTIALGLAAVSAAIAGYSAHQQQKSSNDAAKFNARVGEIQAEQAQARGTADEERLRLQSAQLRGRQRAAIAGTGVDQAKGSALDVISDTGALTAIDAAAIRQNTANEVWSYKTQSALDSSATGSPALAAAPSVLGGAAQFADRWYTYKGGGTTAAAGVRA